MLRLAASLERASEHPLAAAIVRGAAARGVALGEATGVETLAGRGVRGRVEGRAVALGNARLLVELGVDGGVAAARADELRAAGETVAFVVVDGRLAGLLGLADPIKAGTAEVIATLRADGLRTVMLTGDGRATAEVVGRQVGIDEVVAEVLPADKAAVVEKLQAEGRVVAMAGDGINDAPALARAHVGIAMGTGSDVALESAGVTLLKGDLGGLLRARRLSRADDRQHQAEPLLRLRLQRARRADRRRRALSAVSAAADPRARGGRDGALVGLGGRQRAAAAREADLTSLSDRPARNW